MARVAVLPVAQGRIVGFLMNVEPERMWKEVVVVYCQLLFWHSPGETEKPRTFSVIVGYVPAEIRTKRPPE
jgi:hypothetical protein